MATSYYDIKRLEGTETGLHGIQRAGQDGYATDTNKLLHKWAGGGVSKYSADGTSFTGVNAADVDYSYGGWTDIDTVKEALDALRAESELLSTGSGSVTMVGLTGASGGSNPTTAQYTWTLKSNIAEFTLVVDATNYGNASATTLVMANFPPEVWPTSVVTYLPCSIRDSSILTAAYGMGAMKLPAYDGATGSSTGVLCCLTAASAVSGYTEYAESGWTPTGIHGVLRGSWRYPLSAAV